MICRVLRETICCRIGAMVCIDLQDPVGADGATKTCPTMHMANTEKLGAIVELLDTEFQDECAGKLADARFALSKWRTATNFKSLHRALRGDRADDFEFLVDTLKACKSSTVKKDDMTLKAMYQKLHGTWRLIADKIADLDCTAGEIKVHLDACLLLKEEDYAGSDLNVCPQLLSLNNDAVT